MYTPLNNHSNLTHNKIRFVPDQQIGMGYNTTTQTGTSTFCVDASVEKISTHGQPVSVIGFGSSMDFSQTQQDLDVNVAAKVNIDKFSGSLKAEYAKNIQDTGYSMSYSFVYKIDLPTQVLHVQKFGPDSLNEFGKGAFKEGLERFNEICGDKFIVQEFTGAKLYTSLKINFESKYDKSNFALNFKGSISDIGSAMLDVKNTAETHNIKGSIELSAIQEGGDVMRLTEIFGKTEDNNILKCRLTQSGNPKDADYTGIEKCQDVLSDIINYAKLNFSEQIYYNKTGSGNIVGVPTSHSYTYLEYNKIGIDQQHTGVDQDVIDIRQKLGELYDKTREAKTYLSTIINSSDLSGLLKPYNSRDHLDVKPEWSGKWHWQPDLIGIAESAQLRNSNANAGRIIEALESKYDGALICYTNPSSCKKVNETISQVVAKNPISYPTIDFFKKAYEFNVKCGSDTNKTDYGIRYMLPIAREDDANYYVERSEFIFEEGSKHPAKNVTNVISAHVNNDGEMVLKANSHTCGSFSNKSSGEEAIPVYCGDIKDANCMAD